MMAWPSLSVARWASSPWAKRPRGVVLPVVQAGEVDQFRADVHELGDLVAACVVALELAHDQFRVADRGDRNVAGAAELLDRQPQIGLVGVVARQNHGGAEARVDKCPELVDQQAQDTSGGRLPMRGLTSPITS